jgi:hypothetical protein
LEPDDEPSVETPEPSVETPEEDRQVVEEEKADAITLSIPKDFDLNDEEAWRTLLASAKNGTPISMHVETTDNHADGVSRLTKRLDPNEADDDEVGRIEVTKSGTIFTAAEAMSPESIFKMFMHSPMGIKTKDNNGKTLKYDAVFDLVQVFSAMNFSEQVPDETLKRVAADIVAKSEQSEAPKTEEPQVIHLEDYPSPELRMAKAFKFDSIEEEENSKDEPKPVVPALTPKKARLTPEARTPRRNKAAGTR